MLTYSCNMKIRYNKNTPLLNVKIPVIGSLYHLSWARKRGMVWRLVSIDGEYAVLKTPVTNKEIRSKLDTLRHTRTNQTKINLGKKKQ